MSRVPLTSLKSKVWLVFLKQRSLPYSKLSFNIVREVCIYLGSFYLLPCLNHQRLVLHDLETGEAKTISLDKSFECGTSFCWYKERSLIFVGNQEHSSEVWLFDPDSNIFTRLADMLVKRAWSGIVEAKNTVYVFGGNNSPPLKSCEKFEGKEWDPLPEMHSSKTAFTPCVKGELIYLICPMPEKSPFEVFSIDSGTFRELNMFVISSGYGSVSFLVGQTFLILTYDKRLIKWEVESTETVISDNLMKNTDSAITNTHPLQMNQVVYWPNYMTGDLIMFDLMTMKMPREYLT